jgi:hypothetical protein
VIGSERDGAFHQGRINFRSCAAKREKKYLAANDSGPLDMFDDATHARENWCTIWCYGRFV